MTLDFDPSQISPQAYRERIRALETRLTAQREAYAKTERELAWWREGLALFAPDSPSRPQAEPEAAPSVNGVKPVLREALLGIMREGKATGKDTWKAPELIQVLTKRGWMPNGKSAPHIVRSRLSTLAKSDELQRVGYGEYALPESRDPEDPGG